MAEAENFLALRSEDPKKYFLNGGWTIQWNGDYKVAGTTFTYKRMGNWENLTSPGPTEEPVWIQVGKGGFAAALLCYALCLGPCLGKAVCPIEGLPSVGAIGSFCPEHSWTTAVAALWLPSLVGKLEVSLGFSIGRDGLRSQRH